MLTRSVMHNATGATPSSSPARTVFHIITRGKVRGRKGVFRVECSCKAFRIDALAHNLAERRRQDRRMTEHLAANGAGELLAAQASEAPLSP